MVHDKGYFANVVFSSCANGLGGTQNHGIALVAVM
jgi:hypothetical protein